MFSSSDSPLEGLINRPRPSWWTVFLSDPIRTLARTLNRQRQGLIKPRAVTDQRISVACISDTHNEQIRFPDADLLIHAGDLTQNGSLPELESALNWLGGLPHTQKIVIAGNHDAILSEDATREAINEGRFGAMTYLDRSSSVLSFAGGRKIMAYGNPLTRRHGSWKFQFEKERDVFSGTVPDDTDILVTHSPPRHHLDANGLGDDRLTGEVWRVKPLLHVFGHVHEGYGMETLLFDDFQRHYEDICRGNGGFAKLARMGVLFLKQVVFGVPSSGRRTISINAAIVGGLMDRERRAAALVEI